MYKLVISDDEGKTTVVPLVRDAVTIGRKEGNTIRLTERNVSRRHAKLTKQNGHFVLEDLKSYNGVSVNGKRIEEMFELKAGDKIAIGDYSLALQYDAIDTTTIPAKTAPQSAADPATAMIATPEAAPPARLVMVSPPAPGAEFALSKPKLRVGRAEDLDLWINHRSISREHAEIEKTDKGIHVRDLGSANGMRVNGKDIRDAQLVPGDLLELGQVRFRFIGEGELYTFDADRTAQMDSVADAPRPSGKTPWAIGGVILGISVAIAVMAALRTPDPPPSPGLEDPPNPSVNTLRPNPPVRPNANVPPVSSDDRVFREDLASCERAVAAGSIDEAFAYARSALVRRPEDGTARACRDRAEAARAELSVFEQGRAALERGDIDGAYMSFASLPPTSPLRERPEVGRAADAFVQRHLLLARRTLRTNPAGAAREAEMVLTVSPLGPAAQREAELIVRRAQLQQVAVVTVTPRPGPGRDAGTTQTDVSPRLSPLQQAQACLAAGDNPCAIRALEGRARTCQELALLIETYRVTGSQPSALRHMPTFLERCPTHPNAQHYRQMVARMGGG